jgi:hypothetical protein
VESRRHQVGQRREGRLGIRPAGLQLQPGAASGGQHGEVEEALAVDTEAVAMDPNLGREPPRQADELARGPQVQAEGIEDHHRAANGRHGVVLRLGLRPR